jgi:hypothetical protein
VTSVNPLPTNPTPFEILSVAFELAEYSLQHQLANFAEVSLFVLPSMTQLKLGAYSVGGIMSVFRVATRSQSEPSSFPSGSWTC